jgi:uncharacterized protein (DUF1697 family)
MLRAMARYAALLRGVSPMNLKMPELKRGLEIGGFTEVRTLLSSGNAVFSTKKTAQRSLERKVEDALQAHLGKTFTTFIRSIDQLQALLAHDPYAGVRLPAGSKRVVTFLPASHRGALELPITLHDACIVAVDGCEVFSSYVPGPQGPVFMTLIEKTFGKNVTTRTWGTIEKVVKAGLG